MLAGRLIFACLSGVLFILGLSNILVLFIVAGYQRMRTVTNVLIFNLCLADLIYISFLPVVIAFQIFADWKFGLFVCKLVYAAESTAKYASVYFVCVLSFDRYLAICCPVWCRKYRNPTLAIIVSVAGWFLTAAMMIPIYMYTAVIGPVGGTKTCTVVWPSASDFLTRLTAFDDDDDEFVFYSSENATNHTQITMEESMNGSFMPIQYYSPSGQMYYVVSTFIFCFGVPAIAIVYCYIKVVEELMQASCRAERLKRRYEKTYKKVTRMVLAVITCYIACWMPYWIQFLVVTFITNIRLSNALKILFNSIHLLPYLNCSVNPILYTMMTEDFRCSFREFCSGQEEELNRRRRSSVNSVKRKFTITTSPSLRRRMPTMTHLDKIQFDCEPVDLMTGEKGTRACSPLLQFTQLMQQPAMRISSSTSRCLSSQQDNPTSTTTLLQCGPDTITVTPISLEHRRSCC